MITLFSKSYGKISAGTSISERVKSKSALALRPFVYGKYRIRKTGDSFHINDCETISSHYSIGDDIDKYLCASYGMEFTNKLLPEEAAEPRLFVLFSEFLDIMERRTSKYETLLIAYQVKVINVLGNAPRMESCVLCGSKDNLNGFSVEDGGVICKGCASLTDNNRRLIYNAEFDIVGIMNFLEQRPLSQLENLALDENILKWMREVLRNYIACHLGISCLKSEEYMGLP